MKKLLFLFLILVSCEKETPQEAKLCWSCNQDIITSRGAVSSIKDYCYYTKSQIDALEAKNSYMRSDTVATFVCKIKN